MLATGDLLFRPADLGGELAGMPIHKVLLVPCTVLALPRLLQALTPRALRRCPISVPLMLLVAAVVLSHLSHLRVYEARVGGVEMAKACLFSLLVVALVDSLARLRLLLWTMTGAVTLMCCLAVAQRHGFVDIAALSEVEQRVVGSEERATVTRLCGIGVFHDPNDLSLVIVLAITVCATALWDWRERGARWLLLGPLALLGYALVLTQSRGGAISGAAALGTLAVARVGWRRALVVALPVCGLLLGPVAIRGLSLEDPMDTFQARLRLWDGSLNAFLAAPVFGMGQGKLVDVLDQVTHNSYLHAFAEMGVFGGLLFLGSFGFLTHALWRLAPRIEEFVRMRPCLLAIAIGYGVGLLSLSRCYMATTYLVLALGAAFLGVAWRAGVEPAPRLRFRTVVLAGAAFLAGVGVFVQIMLHGAKP
jgi:O-antigen ligase